MTPLPEPPPPAGQLSEAWAEKMALEWAVRFHDTYERLAPSFGYETRPDTKTFDPTTPNGRLMVAVCGEIARAAWAAGPGPGLAEALEDLEQRTEELSVNLSAYDIGRISATELIALAARLFGEPSPQARLALSSLGGSET